MNVRREDKIRLGCAFIGAAIGAFIAAPMLGGTPAVFTVVGVVLGYSVAKVIIAHLDHAELARSEEQARASAANNDAEFAKALFDEDGPDKP